MSNIEISFDSIIVNLEDDSRTKLTKLNPNIDQFSKYFEQRYLVITFYQKVEEIARVIYSWKEEGRWGGYTIAEFKAACLNLRNIQSEYDSYNFTKIDNKFDELDNELEKYSDPVDKFNAINVMLTERYAKQANNLNDEEKSINLEQINLLIELRNYFRLLIDNIFKPVISDMETVYREVCTEQTVLKKSKFLKIIVEDDIKDKLYDELSHNIDHSEILLFKRKDFGPGGNFDIVVTKDFKNVTGREIHFAPCNFKKLISLFESIVKKDVKRAKFVQAMRPNAWYNHLVGKEFFVTFDELDRLIALQIESKNVWEIDIKLLKDKYVDVLSVTQVKKIESKQIKKGYTVEWH